MDNIIITLLSWQFIFFGLAISAIVFVLRTIAEYVTSLKKPIQESGLWKDLLLPISPVIIGSVGAAILSSYPYPENITTSGARIAFGLIAGLFSGLIYRVIKALITQKAFGTVTDVGEEK